MKSPTRFRGAYDADSDTWQLAEIDHILGQANHGPSDRILDLGCGDGGRVRALALRGYKNVVGLDSPPAIVGTTRQRSQKKSFQGSFVQADPLHCPFPDHSFDEILILGDLFGHSGSPIHDAELLKEAQRMLRAGGTLWLSMVDGEWVRTHYQPDGVEPLVSGFLCRHRTLSPDGSRLTTRTIVADQERGVAIDQVFTEWLYEPKTLTNILHQLGFETISYRPSELGFARQIHIRRNTPPRYLVRCSAPCPGGKPVRRIEMAGRQ